MAGRRAGEDHGPGVHRDLHPEETARDLCDEGAECRGMKFFLSICDAPRRDSPRQASNFLLSGQKKVTKEEALNTSHLGVTLRLQRTFSSSPHDSACHTLRLASLRVNSAGPEREVFPRLDLQAVGIGWAVWMSPCSRKQPAKSAGVRRLFFGDFLLARQKKVTRQPGRNPAQSSRSEKKQSKSKDKTQ